MAIGNINVKLDPELQEAVTNFLGTVEEAKQAYLSWRRRLSGFSVKDDTHLYTEWQKNGDIKVTMTPAQWSNYLMWAEKQG